MGRALLYAIISFILTAIVFALLAPLLFQGDDMRKVGQLLGAPVALFAAALGFVLGLLSSRRKKTVKLPEHSDRNDRNNPS